MASPGKKAFPLRIDPALWEELQRLAETVSSKIDQLPPPGKVPSSQSVLLAAMALAHELEEERERRLSVERRAREMFRRVLGRIDDTLGTARDEGPAEAYPAEH